ncbi:DUF2787 domain-containing protein [uncultured Psychrosphaera sp.]|uniref:DUF2787 domain-containing protein n=1 Tax=uncultured Psychrosphaera sp. TaxID=1403522 RepID=UPI00262D6997|nr:DUF2787 domain-containing protein [uncultured Psychrosphaera sp.]
MNLQFNKAQAFALPNTFYNVLNNEYINAPLPGKAITAITFNFSDPNYSAETGGYHPVEVRLKKENDQWNIVYVTDFSYQGRTFPELVKEIDICFITKQVFSLFAGGSVRQHAGNLIQLFINNFIEYYKSGVFDVQVTFE